MNVDNRSMALNDEATLMVLDRTLGAEMDRVFLDDLRYAQEITVKRSARAHGSNASPSAVPTG